MAKSMLIDATHPEETRVAVVDGRKLEEFDVEVATRRPLKGNIYLAKVTRVEPSLQAAFVEYGGNRHGFLAFSEIHPDYYRIPVADREALLREAAEALDDEDEIDAAADARTGRSTSHDDDHAHGDDHGHEDHHHDADHPPADHDSDVIVSESGEFVAAPGSGDGGIDSGGAGSGAATSSPDSGSASWVTEPAIMALDARRDVLLGDVPAESSFETSSSAGEIEIMSPANGEIIEVQLRDEAVDTVGGEEPAIQDDPEADEERARRRRQRNLRRYKIQEVIKRRQILLVQVTKEERGNKGAALTTYLSLAGRYCVLMPNTDRGGGISRRITNAGDRKRLKSIIDDLDAPEGMAVIVRTAGSERSKAEVKRDFEYLIRLWDEIRDVTLRSTAPALIYEEASLIKRSIRDLYTSDIGDIIVAGDDSYRAAKSFMRTLTPSHAKRVQLYRDNSIPLFQRYQIESQLAAIHQPVVQLKSGGYIVINQTEALVAVDVNSGRSTKERNIEETALRTNQEAAEEVARQLRLRDLAGLIVIDFIDMEENRNNAAVERRLKESLKNDRARIQIGRISSFGLLEMSRQRLHPSLAEASTEICPHCAGTGRIRSVDSTALHVLRMVEEEITRSFSPGISVFIPTAVALYILNQKRSSLSELEQRRGVRIYLQADDSLIPPDYRLERIKLLAPGEEVQQRQLPPAKPVEDEIDIEDEIDLDVEAEDDEAETEATEEAAEPASDGGDARSGRRRRRRRRGSRGERFRADEFTEATDSADAGTAEAKPSLPNGNEAGRNEANRGEDGQDDEVEGDFAGDDNGGDEDGPVDGVEAAGDSEQQRRRRRRGRRGGRRRTRRPQEGQGEDQPEQQSDGASAMQAEGEQDRVPTGSSERTDPAIAGFGDQPSLPETLPPHWQQATFPSLAERPASDVTEVAQIETLEAVRVEETAQAEGTVRTESGADQASGTPAAAEEGTEPAAPRRRARREDGERAPRTRKPRKSREETAAAETASADIAEAQVGAVEVAKPASADADSDATTGISEAPEPATPPAPRVRETAIPYAAAPDDVAEAPAAAAPALSNQTTSAPITVTEAPDNAGAPAVTVLDQQSDEDNDGEPKRRGWWRRLME